MDPLRQWAIATGGMKIHADILAKSIPSMGGGVGVVTSKSISAGQLIVQVPKHFMLTTRSAREYLSKLLPPPSRLEELTPVEIIMSFLILAENDAQHVHYPWLRALPRSYDNLLELPYDSAPSPSAASTDDATAAAYDASIRPFVWSARCRSKCVEERLRFESSVRRCKERIPQLRRCGSATHAVFEDRFPVGRVDHKAATDQEDDDDVVPAHIPLEKFLWAYNSLMSRGFAYDEDIWAMMPWVDYFNYSLQPNVTMRYNDKHLRYEFITRHKIAAGEQLMLQYGSYADFELLLWYGFTLRRVLFPSCKPNRLTTSMKRPSSSSMGDDGVGETQTSEEESAVHNDNNDDDDDHTQIVMLNTLLAYVFSPTYDPNGDLPVGIDWAVAMVRSAGLVCPPEWGLSVGHEAALHDVRISWATVNPGMLFLLRQLVEHNPEPSEVILRKIVQAELNAMTIPSAIDASSYRNTTSTRLAYQVSEDQLMLLKRYAVSMDDAALKSLLVAAGATH